MGVHGWRLFNYPERMSYSATPPDFGSLCIQRRRWANGGLLILPKLRRQSRSRRAQGQRTRFGELFLRCNYMASISWSSASLLILLAFPFAATLISPLLGLVALPYFLAMASDLRYSGYKRAWTYCGSTGSTWSCCRSTWPGPCPRSCRASPRPRPRSRAPPRWRTAPSPRRSSWWLPTC
jgi:hypothetical protein